MWIELERQSSEAKNALWSGETFRNGKTYRVVPGKVPGLSPSRVAFAVVENPFAPVPSLGRRLFAATRAFSLTATATPGLVALLVGLKLEHWTADGTAFALSLLAVVLLQIAVNLFNDVHDHLRGVDLPGDIGGSGVIQKGWLSARTLHRVAQICVCGAILAAVLPILRAPMPLSVVGVLAFIGSAGYSGMGLGFKYRAWGDAVVLLLCGPLLSAGFSFATFGQVSALVLLTGTVLGLAAVGLLHANNLNDIEVDQSRGVRTVASQLGFKGARRYLTWIYAVIAAGIIGVAVWPRPGALAFLSGFLVTPLALRVLKKVRQASGPLAPELAMIRFEAAQIHLAIGIVWIVSLLLV